MTKDYLAPFRDHPFLELPLPTGEDFDLAWEAIDNLVAEGYLDESDVLPVKVWVVHAGNTIARALTARENRTRVVDRPIRHTGRHWRVPNKVAS